MRLVDRLCSILLKRKWTLQRITGSHFIFSKPGRGVLPVSLHGQGRLRPEVFENVLKQLEHLERVALQRKRDKKGSALDGSDGATSTSKTDSSGRRNNRALPWRERFPTILTRASSRRGSSRSWSN